MTVTWFLHVFHLFLLIMFPIWSLQFFSHTKGTRKLKLCILEIVGSVIFSSIFPTIVLSVSHYKNARFPPLIMLPSKKLSLYTMILPVTILMAVGINLIFLSLWKIHKVSVYVIVIPWASDGSYDTKSIDTIDTIKFIVSIDI